MTYKFIVVSRRVKSDKEKVYFGNWRNSYQFYADCDPGSEWFSERSSSE